MKILKKILKIVAVLFLLIIIALIAIPVVFKDDLVAKAKEIANESVNAKVDFGDFSLSLFSSFPNFSFDINDVSVINKAPFEGDTLAYIGNLNLTLDLGSVINGEYVVSEFNISDLTANAKILKDGRANWDIAIEDSSATEEVEVEDTTASDDDLIAGLKSFSLNNVNLSYVDLESEMVAIVKNLNQSGSLQLKGDLTDINVKTAIQSIIFDLEGERLANNLSFDSDVKLQADLNEMVFNFLENEFKFNNLKIGVDGKMTMPNDDIDFDMSIAAKENTFKDLLSVVPTSYLSDLEGVETNGLFHLSTVLKGKMTEELLPAFNVHFDIEDGYLKYPDLPEAVKDIQMNLDIDNKDGVIDHTTVDLKKFYLTIADNPILMKFFVKDIDSDPDMRGSIKSKFQLEKLAQAIPVEEGEEYKGGINIDIDMAGKLSAIENEQYDQFKAKGTVILDQLTYKSTDLPTTFIKTGYLNFSPQYLEVSNFDMKLGKSDLVANGKIDNILSYVFNDSTIVGKFTINSNYFDLNELMEEEEETKAGPENKEDEVSKVLAEAESISTGDALAVEEPLEVFEIPKNVDFVLTSSFKKIDMEDMPITNFVGAIVLKDGIASFKNASLNIFDGKVTLDGDYNTVDMAHPKTKLDFSIDQMKIKSAYKAFNPVQQLVPIAEKAQGEFHTDLKFSTELTDSLTPVYNTMNGKGFLSTTNLGFAETDAWKQLMDALKIKKEKYDKIKAEDVKIYYYFEDGRLKTDPFKLNMGEIKGEVSGSTSFEGGVDYRYALKIPRKMLGNAAGDAAAFAEGLASKYGTNLSVGEFVDLDILVTGTMDKPNYKVVPKGVSGEGNIKNQAKDVISAKVNEAKQKAQEELDKAKQRAQEEADRLKQEAEAKAQAEAERLKKETEDKAKTEAEKAKQKAKDELNKKAKDALKGIGF